MPLFHDSRISSNVFKEREKARRIVSFPMAKVAINAQMAFGQRDILYG
ncbi:hypothetical protein HMPREF6485_2416 [Segatella buccae ATCC 33574]|uniref:Uncharacterized protein n=1 Tax=Segatella buccae ATCC 33574 TaxID=873513 RepID=E6K9Y0_9BACT|nr:hypothetical protein HMPREF6485_2416 [Segatella buccae ATCC 33574]